jgi:hypothetical protein
VSSWRFVTVRSILTLSASFSFDRDGEFYSKENRERETGLQIFIPITEKVYSHLDEP